MCNIIVNKFVSFYWILNSISIILKINFPKFHNLILLWLLLHFNIPLGKPLRLMNVEWKKELYFNDLQFNDFTLYFSFGICATTVAKLVLLQSFGRKYFSVKIANGRVFTTIKHKWKLLSAAGRTPKYELSHKPKILYMASF